MKIDQAKLLSKQLDQVSRARVVYLLADLMYFVFPNVSITMHKSNMK